MLSRVLGLAALMLAACSFAAVRAQAQENLEAGKSPSQIFAGTCTACHKSPRGLMKTVSPSSLPGFLRQHYTTSSNMAGVLASYLTSNGATDTRYAVGQPNQQKGMKDAAREASPDQPEHPGRRSHPGVTASQEPAERSSARPDADAPPNPQAEPSAHASRNARQHLARPTDGPDVSRPEADGQLPAQAAIGPDGRRSSAKQRLGRHGKPGDELPKTDTTREEPAGAEPSRNDTVNLDGAKPEAAKPEAVKPEPAKPESATLEGAKPAGSGRSETAIVEPPKESEMPASRIDPVPPVTPAPASVSSDAPTSAGGAEPPTTAAVPSPAVTASAPSAAPVPPAGPPAPPISQ